MGMEAATVVAADEVERKVEMIWVEAYCRCRKGEQAQEKVVEEEIEETEEEVKEEEEEEEEE